MCPATTGIAISTWVYGAIMVGTAAYSVYSMDQQASDANKAAQAQLDIESDRAEEDAMNNRNNLNSESLQVATRYQQNRQKLKMDALRAQSAARAKSAEQGVGGISAIRSFISEEISEDIARSDIEQQVGFDQFNLNQKARGILTQRDNRLQDANTRFSAGVRRRAGALDYGLAVGGAAASAYAMNPSGLKTSGKTGS